MQDIFNFSFSEQTFPTQCEFTSNVVFTESNPLCILISVVTTSGSDIFK